MSEPTPESVAADIVKRPTYGAAIVPHPNYYPGNIADADTLRACIEGAIRDAEARGAARAQTVCSAAIESCTVGYQPDAVIRALPFPGAEPPG